MSAASIPADRAGGYVRYLEGKTVAAGRGDYYLTPDGERVEAPGRWLSAQATLIRLGIEERQARGEDFVALMEGRDPATGSWLRPEGAGGGRGGGIDATFSAPKSVSVVWALADPWQREQIEQAQPWRSSRPSRTCGSGWRWCDASTAARSSRSWRTT